MSTDGRQQTLASETEKRPSGCQSAIAFVVGLIFALGATLIFFSNLIAPVYGWWQARSWTETPCVVVSSEGKVEGAAKGQRRAIAVQFTYFWNNKKYTSNQYSPFDFFGNASAQKTIVASYPRGIETTCYVNPRSPSEAVLNRDFDSGCLGVLVGLPLLGLGIATMWAALTGRLS